LYNITIGWGTLHFKMTSTPSTWATLDKDIPETSISQEHHPFVPSPYIETGDIAFKDKTEITLNSAEKSNPIYYSLDNDAYQLYTKPFTLKEATLLKVYAENSELKSSILETKFYKIDPNLSIKLNTEFANRYSGGGNNALIDGVFGTADFRTGTWQGYFDENLEAVLDLGTLKNIESIKINFLEDQRSWIFSPIKVAFYASKDEKSYDLISQTNFGPTNPNENVIVSTAKSKNIDKKYRFIKVKAEKLGDLPEWHLGFQHDGKSWIFADEITIK
jgi:hypothetical protein